MAYSWVDLAGTGGQQNFNFSIPYLSSSHLTVTIDSILTTAWTLTSTYVLRLDSPLSADATVRIRRITPIDEPVVDFSNGSTLGESDLDMALAQIIYAAQELEDATSVSGLADAVISCATSAAAALASEVAAAASEAAAAASEAAAAASATAAQTAQTAAELAETNAETAETNAELAETNAETAETNAAASAAAAAASATAAQTAETNAETAETNAETAQAAAEAARDAALTAETNAETAETNAETAQAAAEAAQAAAEAVAGAEVDIDNLVLNGAMEIWQRGATFAAAVSQSFTADRWKFGYSGAVVATVQRSTAVPTVAEAGVAFNYALEVDITTADASLAATDYCMVFQSIEGHNWRHFAQRNLTLTFWVKSTKTGIHCVALTNGGLDRTFLAEYTVNAADTWEKKTISITASPSAGTWDYTTGIGIQLRFALAAGSNFHSTTGWTTGNFVATANQVNCLDSTSNFFRVTGVKIESGSVATPWQHRPIELELAMCQRYYEIGPYAIFSGDVTSGAGNYYCPVWFRTSKRVAPTIVSTDGSNSGFPAGAPATLTSNTEMFVVGKTPNATQLGFYIFSWTAASEL